MVSRQVWRAIKAKNSGFPSDHLFLVVQGAKKNQENNLSMITDLILNVINLRKDLNNKINRNNF